MGLSDWATVVIAVTTLIYTIGTILLWRESVNTRRSIASSLKLTFLVDYFRAKRNEGLRQAENRGETRGLISERHRWFDMKEKDLLLKWFPELRSMVEEVESQTRPPAKGV